MKEKKELTDKERIRILFIAVLFTVSALTAMPLVMAVVDPGLNWNSYIPANDTQPNSIVLNSFSSANIQFNETGLSGATWSVTAQGLDPYSEFITKSFTSNTTTIQAFAYFGAGQYVSYTVTDASNGINAYAPNPSSGRVLLGSGTTYVDITYSELTNVNTVAVSLPNGLPGIFYGGLWKGSIKGLSNGYSVSWNTASMYFTYLLPNGTYQMHVDSTSEYVPVNPYVNFTLAGSPITLTVTMNTNITGQTYAVSFKELNLPSGTAWTLNVTGNGVNESITSTSQYIQVNLTGGDTYNYSANSTGHICLLPANSSFEFNSWAQQVSVPFQTYTGAFNYLNDLAAVIGLNTTTLFGVILGAITIIMVIIIARWTDEAIFPAIGLVIAAWTARAFQAIPTGYAIMFTAIGIAGYVLADQIDKRGVAD